MKINDEAFHLLRFEHPEKDSILLQELQQAQSIADCAKKLGRSRHSVSRQVQRIRKHAERFGFRRDDPVASTVMVEPISGKSRLIKYDEPREDGTVLEWVKTKAEAQDQIEAIKHAIQGLAIEPVSPKKAEIGKTSDVLPVLNLADAHLGILAYDNGEKWGLEENITLLKKAILYLVTKMEPCEEALFINHGDITHSDGMIPQTPKNKNPLDVSDTYFKSVEAAGEIIRFSIDLMLTKAKKVTVINTRGNHDEQTAFHVNEQMKQLYKLEPRVKVLDNKEKHIPFSWKNNFIVATHGDSAPNDRAYQYVTTRWAKECGKHQHIYVMKGHIHHERSQDIGNMTFETFSSLTKADAYHEHCMYKSRRKMSLVNLHPEGGEDSRITYTPRLGL